MSGRAALAEFVRTALIAGHDRALIKSQITGAGWSAQEADAALGVWADTDFQPPVPLARPYASPLEAFFYALMLVALISVVVNLMQFAFAVIDMTWQGLGDTQYGLLSRTRWSVAMLIVFTPLLLVLFVRQRRSDRFSTGKRRSLIRKWFSYATMLAAVLVLLGDLVYAIYGFLGSTITTPTLLKVGVVAVLASAVLALYRRDVSEDAA